MKNNTLTTKDTFGNIRTYEITEYIPAHFFVWNIGKNMGNEEYIPICEQLYPGLPKSNPESYAINPETGKERERYFKGSCRVWRNFKKRSRIHIEKKCKICYAKT